MPQLSPCTQHVLGSYRAQTKSFSCGRCAQPLTDKEVQEINFRMRAAKTKAQAQIAVEVDRIMKEAKAREAEQERQYQEWLKTQPADVQAFEKAKADAAKAKTESKPKT
jgi:hypothetical protein